MLTDETPDQFLSRHWQKSTRFMKAAAGAGLPQLDGDELAWLAIQPDVESRLVFTERRDGSCAYRLENGPFTESRLRSLPSRDWTLLVNDVDKHLPDFRAYLELLEFVPDWRIDDLMVSFAAPGGGVGPHVDNYDVFLVQGSGARKWRIGRRGCTEPDDRSPPLSLVRPFEPEECVDAESGDILYLPPGVPHWGIAGNHCMTYSIGMRAPTAEELGVAAARCLDSDTRRTGRGELRFYADPDLVAGEAAPGKIDRRAVERLREQDLVDTSLSDADVATILGCCVTDLKAWLAPDGVSGNEATEAIAGERPLPVHGMARIAWFSQRGHGQVFVNGVARAVEPSELDIVSAVCRRRRLDAAGKRRLTALPDGPALLHWLLAEGLFDPGDARR
jgi:50S ribosomal protein L16 3-hydroxylase